MSEEKKRLFVALDTTANAATRDERRVEEEKKIGIVGLGKMGEAIAYRVLKKFQVIGFDRDENTRKQLEKIGGESVDTIEKLAKTCNIIWLMVPAGKIVDDVLEEIIPHLQPKAIIIDGGNSYFQDSVRRAQMLEKKEIYFLDCGTSGGLKGREIGFSLMIGGLNRSAKKNKDIFEYVDPVFQAIAAPNGYGYLGPAGAGHYVKMIHNGIEYSLLQAYAEGFNLLKHGTYKNLDLAKIADVWAHGSVIRSWIVELSRDIFSQDQEFSTISGAIGENLTGQWTLKEAKGQNIEMDLLERSLKIRAWSRETGGNYATKIVAMLRLAFGGHKVGKK